MHTRTAITLALALSCQLLARVDGSAQIPPRASPPNPTQDTADVPIHAIGSDSTLPLGGSPASW